MGMTGEGGLVEQHIDGESRTAAGRFLGFSENLVVIGVRVWEMDKGGKRRQR